MEKFLRLVLSISHRSLLLAGVILLWPSAAIAQQTKQPLPKEQLEYLSQLSLSCISGNGKWVAYNLSYPKAKDTLCVKATDANSIYKLPGARQPAFVGSEAFVALMPGNVLCLVELHSGRITKIPDAIEYDLPQGEKYVVVRLQNDAALIIIDGITGDIVKKVDNISEYSLHKESAQLAYTVLEPGKNRLLIMNLQKKPEEMILPINTSRPVKGLEWHRQGLALAYFGHNEGSATEICLYQIQKKKTLTYPIPANGALSCLKYVQSLSISDDASRVFIQTFQPEVTPESKARPEVWNGNDKWLHPLAYYMDQELRLKHYVWQPGNAPALLNGDHLPVMRLSGRKNYALLNDPSRYAPQYTLEPDTDYYIRNVDTGVTKPLVKGISTSQGWLSVCPYSDDIAYFKDGNWWLYEPVPGKTSCLTCGIKTKWDNAATNVMPPVAPYGIAAWASDGKSLLICDTHDIWCIATKEKNTQKLTKGSETQTVFRLADQAINYTLEDIIKGKSLIFHGQSLTDNSEDYYGFEVKKGAFGLTPGKGLVRQIRTAQQGGAAYIWERYDTPSCIYHVQPGGKQAQRIVATNETQYKYLWGHSELITFDTKKGSSKAALFYPAGYEKGKRYPMITYIYEELSQKLHQYSTPLQNGSVGFNVTEYTLNGYLVLMPDIHYQNGNPGISAAESVVAAVDKVIDMGIVDPGAIGLMGTSFGGYETGFIITQTNKFAAAVGGAGIYDLPSFYFTMGKDLLRTEAWRFENQIFRMGFPYYQNQQAYVNNSPLQQADQLTTPLLIWCGKHDPVVPWEQSLMFYSALKRLNKKTILLAYPDEAHALSREENQADLSGRTRQWFDHFLKGKQSDWIQSGTGNK